MPLFEGKLALPNSAPMSIAELVRMSVTFEVRSLLVAVSAASAAAAAAVASSIAASRAMRSAMSGGRDT